MSSLNESSTAGFPWEEYRFHMDHSRRDPNKLLGREVQVVWGFTEYLVEGFFGLNSCPFDGFSKPFLMIEVFENSLL